MYRESLAPAGAAAAQAKIRFTTGAVKTLGGKDLFRIASTKRDHCKEG